MVSAQKKPSRNRSRLRFWRDRSLFIFETEVTACLAALGMKTFQLKDDPVYILFERVDSYSGRLWTRNHEVIEQNVHAAFLVRTGNQPNIAVCQGGIGHTIYLHAVDI